jgi:hypothetical protein
VPPRQKPITSKSVAETVSIASMVPVTHEIDPDVDTMIFLKHKSIVFVPYDVSMKIKVHAEVRMVVEADIKQYAGTFDVTEEESAEDNSGIWTAASGKCPQDYLCYSGHAA